MKNAIRWFSRNHVAGNFLMGGIILAGLFTWFKLKKEIFPETSLDAIAVRIPYPTATPDEVERGVCVPIEEAIADLEGIEQIQSTASQNMGTVVVRVETGYDVRNVMDDVKTRIDAIQNLAENAERPVIEELLLKHQVMSLAVSADTDEKTLRQLAENVRDGLLAYEPPPPKGPAQWISRQIRGTPSITQVELTAVRPYEISIEVSEETLRRYGLSLEQVANAVRASSIDLPAGSVRTKAGEIMLQARGKRYDAAQFSNIVVQTLPDGSEVRLGKIAEIINGFEDIDIDSRFDGRPAILVNIYRTGEQDTLQIAQMVETYLEQIHGELPEGVTVEKWNDTSQYLKGRLRLLAKNATFGLALVLLVLTLFLRPSLAILVALGIPASFAGGIWMMPHLGISINMISIFAFILVLGIVVDDAIVIGENVYTRIQRGEHPRKAAWKGTHEVGVVVIFGVLTTIAAFMPMLGLRGVSGKIWPNIPLVVIPVLLFSLLQSKLVLPAHLALLKPTDRSRKVNPLFRLQRKIADGLERFIHEVYQPILAFSLHWRYVVAAIFIAAMLVIAGLVWGGWIKTQFFPEVEGDVLSAKLEMPLGAPFEETSAAVDRIERAAKQLAADFHDRDGNPIVVHMLASSGTQPFQTNFSPEGVPKSSNLGEVTVELVPSANRPDLSAEDLVTEWRRLAGTIPGAVDLNFRAETARGGNAIDVTIVGKDTEQLEEAVAWIKSQLADYDGVVDISDSNRPGRSEQRFDDLTPAGHAAGFSLAEVARQIRAAFYGDEVQRLQRGRDEVKVMVRYPRDERESLHDFERMKLHKRDGSEVPVLEVVEPKQARGPAAITRTDRFRSIKIMADVEQGANANQIVKRFTAEVLDHVGERFPGVRYEYEGEQKDQRDSMHDLTIGFIFALIGMYVLMAIPLKSYFQPLIVMCVIPFGLVGAVVGHMLMGMVLSIMSMCGIVALAGVVVNDSLVLVDYVNRHRKEAGSVAEAAKLAGVARFRAILLTSLTTFAGLMPMLTETDMQARFLVPMAVSLGFGILFATFITLFLVPSVYLMMEDAKALFSRKS
jgi:multidrug efflux pump subunit AcrB